MAPTSEQELHRTLASFGPAIIDALDSIDFWELEGEYDAQEVIASIPVREKEKYEAKSEKKNSRVWGIVAGLFIGAGINSGIKQIRRDYAPQIARFEATEKKPKLSAQDYQNQYIKEHGGEFITKMSKTDQVKLTRFLWQNAGKNERPLARTVLKTEPQLAYLVDNKESRLRTIKRTEVGRATRYGGWKFAGDNGAKTKIRNEVGDSRTRPSHRAMMGEEVPINEPYSNGEQYPGENDINCRGHNEYNF